MPPVEPPVQKPTSTDTVPATPAKSSLKVRFKTLFNEYGPLALLIYLSTSVLSIAGFMVAIRAGVDLQALSERFGVQLGGTGGLIATFGAAWVFMKALTVPRLFATLLLTPIVGRIPFVARFLRRFQERQEEAKG
jgi:hypothetical protein